MLELLKNNSTCIRFICFRHEISLIKGIINEIIQTITASAFHYFIFTQ